MNDESSCLYIFDLFNCIYTSTMHSFRNIVNRSESYYVFTEAPKRVITSRIVHHCPLKNHSWSRFYVCFAKYMTYNGVTQYYISCHILCLTRPVARVFVRGGGSLKKIFGPFSYQKFYIGKKRLKCFQKPIKRLKWPNWTLCFQVLMHPAPDQP